MLVPPLEFLIQLSSRGSLLEKGISLTDSSVMSKLLAHQCERWCSPQGAGSFEKCAEPEPLVLPNPVALVVGSGQFLFTDLSVSNP